MKRLLLYLLVLFCACFCCSLYAQTPSPPWLSVATLPSAATAVQGMPYNWTQATTANTCPSAGAGGSGGSAKAGCITLDGSTWTSIGGGAATWGSIGGTLSAQSDLNTALAGKASTTHATTHQNGGSDEVATATPAANAIPKAGGGGTLAAGWFPTLNQSTTGNAATATALASSPTGCTNQWATGVAASGNASCSDITRLNGVLLSGLGTGILKNTTGTGAPSIAIAADFPTLNQNTTGTAANLSGTPAVPNGTTATTQSAGDNSTKLATTAYADNAGSGSGKVAGAANLTISGCLTFQVSSGTVTCLTGLTWDGTNINVPGGVKLSGSGTSAIDFNVGTTPSNPASGAKSLFFDSANSNRLSSLTSSGTVKDLEAPGPFVSLTTTGTSGAATLVSGVLNVPQYNAPSSPFLESHTASSSAELDFTGCISNTNYDEFEINTLQLVVATGTVHIILQFSSDGGATWITSGYSWGAFRFTSGASAAAGSASDSGININGGSTMVNTSASSAWLRLKNPRSSTVGKQLIGVTLGNDGSGYGSTMFGGYGTTAVNAFRIKADSGNLASGTATCLGVPKI